MPLVLPILCPYAGGAELASILVKLQPGASISEIIGLAEKVCKPLFIITPYQLSSDNKMIIIVDKKYAETVCKELKKSSLVTDLQVYDEMPVEIAFPLKVGSVRVIVYSERSLKAIFAEAYNYMQPSIVMAMLFHIGFMTGMSIATHLLNENPSADPYALLTHYLTRCFPAWGDGLVLDIARNKDKYILVVQDLIECKVQVEIGIRHGSHFYRGLFAGLFSGALRKEYVALERTCLTKGDPYCTFILVPKAEVQKQKESP